MFSILAAFGLGGLGWTFAEYGIHNWVMHMGKGKNEFSRQHLNHHASPNEFHLLWGKYATEFIVVSALLGLAWRLFGWKVGAAYSSGFVAAYHFYEWLHEHLHVAPPRGPVGRFLRRHHMIHHFVAPTANHGVTIPLWDLLFGTYRTDGAVIVVPERHAPRWLLDPATREVKARYAEDYAVRRTGLSQRQAELDRELAFSNRVLV